MNKIALSFLTILYAQTCAAQLIDVRSALSLLSEYKLATTLCAIGFGSIIAGKIIDRKKQAAKAEIDVYHKKNELKIAGFLEKQRKKNITQENFSTDAYDEMKKKCSEDAKIISNSIGSKECHFFATPTTISNDMNTLFYQARITPGTLKYKNNDISGCYNIEQRERFACWVPKISYAIGGLSLLGAGIVAATKIAAK